MRGMSRLELVAEGMAARRAGLSRDACPSDSAMRGYWLEGYDRAYEPLAKRFESGGPLLAGAPVEVSRPVGEGWDY